MCENENVKIDRMRCEACRTINLAKNIQYPKPDMQVYNKTCTPAPPPCIPITGTYIPLYSPICKRINNSNNATSLIHYTRKPCVS